MEMLEKTLHPWGVVVGEVELPARARPGTIMVGLVAEDAAVPNQIGPQAHWDGCSAVVIDMDAVSGDCCALARGVKSLHPEIRVILLGSGSDVIWSASEAGADAYLLRSPGAPPLHSALDALQLAA
jgi:DNA-binding NarL/FixJ family response regulator